jgi:hypothetical protein
VDNGEGFFLVLHFPLSILISPISQLVLSSTLYKVLILSVSLNNKLKEDQLSDHYKEGCLQVCHQFWGLMAGGLEISLLMKS